MTIDLDQVANAGILAHLRRGSSLRARSGHPATFEQPYLTLGTHPELVERLWEALQKRLPEDCRWVAHGWPVLAHPRTGVIFGWAGGTPTYALRLPARERAEAIARGAQRSFRYGARGEVLDLDAFGEDWVFGRWDASEVDWCLSAYEHAASIDSTPPGG